MNSPQDPTPARVRIAPSPTGDPHVGTAYTGLFNWLLARKTGGQFILRIEDTDQKRSTKESEEAILRSLRWLGLNWDEGPDVGGPFGPYRQSERTEIYRTHAQILLDKGAAYHCFCTAERLAEMRKHQKQNKLTFGYDGLCSRLSEEEAQSRLAEGVSHVVRLKVDKSATTSFVDYLRGTIDIHNENVDDQVLLKSDGFPTYHLANVVDDHLMEVTHVLRAEEWIASTPKHVLLYQAFGWEPPVFCHLSLLRNADKSKISKRKNPTSLDHYRDNGYLPEAMVNFLALMGFAPGEGEGDEVFTIEQLAEVFDLDKLSKTGPVFDLTTLEWLNGEWIRRLEPEDLIARLEASFPEERPVDHDFLVKLLPLIHERLKRLNDFDQWTDFFFRKEILLSRETFRRTRMDPPEMARVLTAAADALDAEDNIEPNRDETVLRDVAKQVGAKVGNFFMTLRVAVTGKAATPPLLECMVLLGKDKSIERLRRAANFLDGTAEPAEL